MKDLFTARVAIIALIFGSSGYGLTTLFPIEHCNTYQKFTYIGIIVAVLTSLLISILIPTRVKKANKKQYNIVLITLFVLSLVSCLLFFNTYNRFTFHPTEFQRSSDSTFTVSVNDSVLFFQSGINGLAPGIKEEAAKRSYYNASDVYYEGGGFESYKEYNIWTKQSMDQSAMLLLLYYLFFIISLIATTFAFLEILKNRKYTEEVTPRKATSKKST